MKANHAPNTLPNLYLNRIFRFVYNNDLAIHVGCYFFGCSSIYVLQCGMPSFVQQNRNRTCVVQKHYLKFNSPGNTKAGKGSTNLCCTMWDAGFLVGSLFDAKAGWFYQVRCVKARFGSINPVHGSGMRIHRCGPLRVAL